MSEKSYQVDGLWIRFSDLDDEFPCLCFFPHNDERVQIDDIKSLALFGAVVRLIKDGYYDDRKGITGYISIPEDVPQGVINAVRKVT